MYGASFLSKVFTYFRDIDRAFSIITEEITYWQFKSFNPFVLIDKFFMESILSLLFTTGTM